MPRQKNRQADTAPRRSSRRIQGLHPRSNSSPTKELYLPYEIRVAVLQYVEKRDLKQVRLVSKEWSSLATTPLFDRVFLSPRKKDLEVWENITRHPTIKDAVTTLVYDTSRFKSRISFKDYYNALWDRMLWISMKLEKDIDHVFETGDAEINAFMKDRCKVYQTEVETSAIQDVHEDDEFVSRGYRKYIKLADSEEFLPQGPLITSMISGLSMLGKLSVVTMDSSHWTLGPIVSTAHGLTLGNLRSGSPFSRCWNPFHVQPSMTCHDEKAALSLRNDFQTLIYGLAESNRQIAQFKLEATVMGAGISPSVLSGPGMSTEQYEQICKAYYHLEVLDLAFFDTQKTRYYGKGPPDALRGVLRYMPNLRSLRLGFPSSLENYRLPRYRYEDIFPSMIWPNLTYLSISGLSINAFHLIQLTCVHPQLQVLCVSRIDLLNGTWKGIIQAWKLKDLTYFSFGLPTIRGVDAFGFSDAEDLEQRDMWNKVEDYVLNGGRHPCLKPEEPRELVLLWYSDLFPDEWRKNARVDAKIMGFEEYGSVLDTLESRL